MKIISKAEQGTVLLIAILTITVMTLIYATSLYITSQNANAGMQTARWQQAQHHLLALFASITPSHGSPAREA